MTMRTCRTLTNAFLLAGPALLIAAAMAGGALVPVLCIAGAIALGIVMASGLRGFAANQQKDQH